jgi:hypothetical protein
LAEVAEQDAVLVGFDQFRKPSTQPDQLGRAAVYYEDAVLNAIAVRAEVAGDPRPPPVIGHVASHIDATEAPGTTGGLVIRPPMLGSPGRHLCRISLLSIASSQARRGQNA